MKRDTSGEAEAAFRLDWLASKLLERFVQQSGDLALAFWYAKYRRVLDGLFREWLSPVEFRRKKT